MHQGSTDLCSRAHRNLEGSDGSKNTPIAGTMGEPCGLETRVSVQGFVTSATGELEQERRWWETVYRALQALTCPSAIGQSQGELIATRKPPRPRK